MPSDGALKDVARLLVGAFDVDIQHWMGNSFAKLRETPAGASFASWAEENSVAFEILLRGTSAVVRQLPKDDNLLVETLYTQLARLPVEVERAVKGDAPIFINSKAKDDEGFFRKYEDAVKDLSDDDLARVAGLDRVRLREWVNSPARVRPHLLTKWIEQDSQRHEKAERSHTAVNESIETAAGVVRKFNDTLKQRQAEREAKESSLSRLQRLKRAIW